MVYGIVKQNNGKIWVSTELSKGTVFEIYLPRSGRAPVKQAVCVPGWGSETVLVVEDQAVLRGTIVDMLRDYGYTVFEAGDGVEALEIVAAKRGAINLVITDVVMPRMSGADLSARLRQSQPEIKLLFISGYVGDQIHRQGGLDKDVVFVQKPFSPTSLVGKVRLVLDMRPSFI
jgi:two-component system cell cycle sensor histidine kinase/response regulator CckA